MREIVLDTETTGFDPETGDRVVEIGCVELNFHVPTGNEYHCYINPERDMPEGAFGVHGLSEEFLSDKPVFANIVDDFLEFIGDDAALVIHNASFDCKFLNAELKWLNRPPLPEARLIDTLEIARRRFPGGANSLDALCRRFEVDLSVRDKHGALVDCQLLAAVYLDLIGGRQPGLSLVVDAQDTSKTQNRSDSGQMAQTSREFRPARPHTASEAEKAAHAAFVDGLKEPIWRA
jgi:DNA polymerase III subunit epsilon